MNVRITILSLLLPFASCHSLDAAAPDAKGSDTVLRKLFVEPSASSLAGGKARLTTSVLTPESGAYVGDYQLKVTPYFFKSEKGKISINASEHGLRKLTQNKPVAFTGKAVTDGTKKTRPIKVEATPSGSDRGALIISIPTENGALVFETSYRFDER